MAGGNDERGQRVRVGLTGLAAVLVIVAAVAAVFESAREEPGVSEALNGAVVENAAAPQDEPLAEIGVVPPSGPENSSLELVPETPPEPVEPTPPPTPIQ